ncbi:hypothetical protein CAC42_4768 [Sphaceloma murrayae]|uniref:MmgE/PrpD family protein n=1 Tax=Sphaceloma murrayae TaxID=2082308 RepID=A0A2K1QNW3_9PEZI|nr:hypothetical protein CAC42_4768 [Sphaceloma murrayae]
MNGTAGHSRLEALATWAAGLTFEHLPDEVVSKTEDFYLDWLACTIAGRRHVAVTSMVKYAKLMGPTDGKCEIIGFGGFTTSPHFAALINGACSHVVEQDDLHNSSMMHPATVVFPAALAVAQDIGVDGKRFIVACVIGYEFACRAGEYLGKSHYEKFHTTATTGVLGAAAASAYLLGLDADTMMSAIGTAGTQAAGLWQFLLDATHSKQVHTGTACANGVMSAYLARSGLLGPKDILEGSRGMATSLSAVETHPSAIDGKLGQRWSILGSSFKWHASCRHTHPSVDALLSLMQRERLIMNDIEDVETKTYKAAINVLSLSEEGSTVHQSKFSMGFVLAVAAKYGHAMITDFTEAALEDQELRSFQKNVHMTLDPEIDALFPEQWTGVVVVKTRSGKVLTEHAHVCKGDPEQTLTRGELEKKFSSLASYGGASDDDQLTTLIARAWSLHEQQDMTGFAFPSL